MSYQRPGKVRRPHAADLYAADQVAKATRFAVHFRKGPFEKYNAEFATLPEAQAQAAAWDVQHGEFGRRSMVYAIGPSGGCFPAC